MAVEEVAEDGTDNERRLDDGREVDAHADGKRRQTETARGALEEKVNEDKHHTQTDADVDILPRELTGENALCDRGHEHRLRCGECLRRIHACARHRSREAVRLVEKVQHGRDDECTDEAADEECNLLTPRRCADEPARLEVLHIVVRDTRNREDDRGGKDGCRRRKFLAALHLEDAERCAERVHDK